jgi:DDE superfamily endonuclease
VWTQDDQAVAAGHSVEAHRWTAEADKLLDGMAGRFPRVETRRRAALFLYGLLADLPRKNCWSIAEHAGENNPHGMLHFLARASWDTDGVRDDLRDYVVGAVGDADGILVVDGTGDVKKGRHTVGVQRQYTGTTGRIENAQVAVYLAYDAGPGGHVMIDRELNLPKSWTDDRDRLAETGVPGKVEFATKPALATGVILRALRAGGAGPVGHRGRGLRAPTPRCAPSWNCSGSATCWPSAVTGGSPPPWARCAPTRSRPDCPGGPGSGSRPGREQRASGSTSGPGSITPTALTTTTPTTPRSGCC